MRNNWIPVLNIIFLAKELGKRKFLKSRKHEKIMNCFSLLFVFLLSLYMERVSENWRQNFPSKIRLASFAWSIAFQPSATRTFPPFFLVSWLFLFSFPTLFQSVQGRRSVPFCRNLHLFLIFFSPFFLSWWSCFPIS